MADNEPGDKQRTSDEIAEEIPTRLTEGAEKRKEHYKPKPATVPVIEPLRGARSSGISPALQPLPPDEKSRWQCRALWHINATAFLLHGYRPQESISPPDRRELKEGYEDIRIAIRAHELQQNPKGELPRDEVIRWAADRRAIYPNFPFANFDGTAQTADTNLVKLLTLTEENTRLQDDLRDAKAEARRLREAIEQWQGDALGAADRADTNGREVDRLTKELAEAKSATTFLDRECAGERYAPKLAAAVKAWRAVVDPNGKHPRTALEEWLTQHAAELGLLKADGTPNRGGIEEIAKVANWRLEGGAPKTPTKSTP